MTQTTQMRPMTTPPSSGAGDFDFLMGRWTIRNRYLRERLRRSDEWLEFTSTCVARPILNGSGIQDEFRTPFWPDFVGMSIRIFDPVAGTWTIHWADSRRGRFDPPVVGSFTRGTGVFEGRDTWDGRPIRVRFIWSRVDTPTPRWEQAFSDDGGVTWETNWVMDFARAPEADTLIELRQYTMKPGRRDDLITLFEERFLEGQAAAGMSVPGHFRDRDRPDRFVWVRGFSDMRSRHTALERFYGGPVWAAHRDAANDTMLEWHDVHLLRPLRPDTGFAVDESRRPAPGERRPASTVLAGIHPLVDAADQLIEGRFERDLAPAIRAAGIHVDGVFVTESSPNTFTRLPVHEGRPVLVWFGTLTGPEVPGAEWLSGAGRSLPSSGEPPQLLVLEPAERSLLGRR